MEKINIKGLDRPVSRLAMGTAWMRPAEEKKADAVLEAFLELDGTLIDTAKVYSGGQAEIYLGGWLRRSGLRSRVQILNKCCHYLVNDQGEHFPEQKRVGPEYITADLQDSLEKLGTEYFDLYILHRDNPEVPCGELLHCLEEHRLAGRIRAYGVSNWTLPRVIQAWEYGKDNRLQGISLNSPCYSLATVGQARWDGCVYADDAYADWHRGSGVTLLAWGAQGSGYFSGRMTAENAPPGFAEAYFNPANAEKLRRAEELAAKYGCSATNIALAYVLSRPLPLAAVISTRSTDHLRSTVEHLKLRLTEAEIDYLSLAAGKI